MPIPAWLYGLSSIVAPAALVVGILWCTSWRQKE